MFDIGWTEMFVVLVVAIIIIGPKDLPRALRTVGHWVGKVRAVGRDFQRGIDDMIRETELDELKKQVEATRKLDLKQKIEDTVDPTGTIKEAVKPIKIGDNDAANEPADQGGGAKTTAPPDTATVPSQKSTDQDDMASEIDTATRPPAKTGT